MVTLSINGRVHQVDVRPDMPLLWVVRDVVGLTGTKFGCGMALCGACTVHLDGQPIRSCSRRAECADRGWRRSIAGRRYRPTEGLGQRKLLRGDGLLAPSLMGRGARILAVADNL